MQSEMPCTCCGTRSCTCNQCGISGIISWNEVNTSAHVALNNFASRQVAFNVVSGDGLITGVLSLIMQSACTKTCHFSVF